MFRENQNTTDAIIELIKTLPETDQQRIVKTVSSGKKKSSREMEKDRRQKIKEMNDFVKKQKVTLPKGFKFDREEAHKR